MGFRASGKPPAALGTPAPPQSPLRFVEADFGAMTTEKLATSAETQGVSWSALWSLLWRSVLLGPFAALIFASYLLIPAGIMLPLNEAILFALKELWWHAGVCVMAVIALMLLGRFLFRRKRSLPQAEPSREGAYL